MMQNIKKIVFYDSTVLLTGSFIAPIVILLLLMSSGTYPSYYWSIPNMHMLCGNRLPPAVQHTPTAIQALIFVGICVFTGFFGMGTALVLLKYIGRLKYLAPVLWLLSLWLLLALFSSAFF